MGSCGAPAVLGYLVIFSYEKNEEKTNVPPIFEIRFRFFWLESPPPPLPIYCTEQKFECDGYLHFIINQAISILVEWVTVYNNFFLKSAKWPLAFGMHIYSTKRSDFF